MENLKTLKMLAMSGAIFIFISWLITDKTWLSSALLNLGTGIITAIVVIYSYDLLLESKKENERIKKQSRALKNQKIVIRQHYRLLLDCYRSASIDSQPPEFKDVNEFLANNYKDVVAHLDIYAPSPSNSDGSVPYYEYIQNSFEQISTSLHNMLLVSGDNLSPDVYTAVDNLLNSEFMRISLSLKDLCKFSIPGIGAIPSELVVGMRRQIENYCVNFSQLLNVMEKYVPQGLREYRKEDWQNLVFPIGHARLHA